MQGKVISCRNMKVRTCAGIVVGCLIEEDEQIGGLANFFISLQWCIYVIRVLSGYKLFFFVCVKKAYIRSSHLRVLSHFINSRHACAVRVTVCLSNQHLTSGASVRPENDIMYSMGNQGQNICVCFSETTRLQRYATSCIVWLSPVGQIVYAHH